MRFLTPNESGLLPLPAFTLKSQVTEPEVESPLQLLLEFPSTEKATAAYADVPAPNEMTRKIRIPENLRTNPPCAALVTR